MVNQHVNDELPVMMYGRSMEEAIKVGVDYMRIMDARKKHWHEQYLGKPWSHEPDPPNSFNCGELLRHVYKVHFGYDAPVILADTNIISSCIDDVRNIRRYYSGMVEAAVPQDFDLAVLSRSDPEHADHVGLYAGGSILHCRPKVGVFLDDAFVLGKMGWRNIRYFRLEGLARCTP